MCDQKFIDFEQKFGMEAAKGRLCLPWTEPDVDRGPGGM